MAATTIERRTRLANKPIPAGFTVRAVSREPLPGFAWEVTAPNGSRYRARGAFYDAHDHPDDTAAAAAVAWGRISVHRRTYTAGEKL